LNSAVTAITARDDNLGILVRKDLANFVHEVGVFLLILDHFFADTFVVLGSRRDQRHFVELASVRGVVTGKRSGEVADLVNLGFAPDVEN
jgi:hypothetical protein